ncbi:MAG: M23 family metallopeptidase [Lunatimonas sp.]|uniref:M23 family metallopeptidase n=1 Tax=Lunatimonas sp. TaxID=2060141 RepID=UPI00263A3F73|nr:M23 family metallopeptidase [Lunatimonas sp.]MCC5937735.1 M23 family metallopeptidase [Lunatimonas sp.]
MSLKQKLNDWIETKFLFVIRREEDFSVITSISITKIRIALLLFLLLITSFGISLVLSKSLLARWFDPAYIESENTARIYQLSEVVDSLILEVQAKDRYVKNIQQIISGGEIPEDTILDQEPAQLEVNRSEIDLYKYSDATLSVISEFESMPLDESSFGRISNSAFADTYFFPPLKGVVVSGYTPSNNHFGVDIVAAENEPIKAIAEGTVIFASWTLETGYVVGIQHSNELISIYKHNSVILKSVGDAVRGGEIVAIIGNTGELTTGQHLHLELWYKGNPLNPQEFITFD